MVRISGDFDRLDDLIAKARTLASPAFQEATLANLAEAARTEIVLGFAGGRDPYGNRWEPLKATRGRRVGGQPLRDTGRLQNSFNVQKTATGIVVRSGVSYAGYHQYGTRRIPARSMVPARRDDLGPYWRRSFIRVLEGQLSRAMRR